MYVTGGPRARRRGVQSARVDAAVRALLRGDDAELDHAVEPARVVATFVNNPPAASAGDARRVFWVDHEVR